MVRSYLLLLVRYSFVWFILEVISYYARECPFPCIRTVVGLLISYVQLVYSKVRKLFSVPFSLSSFLQRPDGLVVTPF